ncbi:MAG: hypothetical protein PHR16_05605 [Methylovulum sp.]|nr:hypothetical protein [Methylovulum sp.]
MKLTLNKQFAGASGLVLGLSLASVALADHPGTQPRPGPSIQTLSADGMTTTVVTPEGHFPPQDIVANPPGSNFLMTVYENARDFNGDEMPNTLPSTPDGRYNLHDGPVLTETINQTNPSEDLDKVIDNLEYVVKYHKPVNLRMLNTGIDILEGNHIRNRAYSGFPMLHYTGPNKIKKVIPICQDAPCHNPLAPGDVVIGGNVDVDMVYWDQHIEADTAFVDPSAVQEVPWTVTYHVNILHGGMEDFSPMVMLFDQNADHTRGPFHVSMDQSYFPMLKEGTRYTVKIKQTKGKYFNLTYTWGWRIHPPRVQVVENALKTTPDGTTLPQHEINVFGINPRGSEANKLAAIAMIGDLSPAKRMWNLLREIRNSNMGSKKLALQVAELRAAYLDWSDRTKLPAGVTADPNANITLFYVNNTIYGSSHGLQGEGSGQGPASYKGISPNGARDWHIRPYNYKVTLYNGDHFPHGYMNVDFGGSRGWENQFQFTDPTTALAPQPHTGPSVIEGSETTITDNLLLDTTPNPAKQSLAIDPITGEHIVTNDKILPMNTGGTEEFLQQSPRNADVNADPQLGSGCFFTFGRNHAWPNAGGPWGSIMVPPVALDGTPGMHKVDITYNFEPSMRLRVYQFDPLHHEQAIFSLH